MSWEPGEHDPGTGRKRVPGLAVTHMLGAL